MLKRVVFKSHITLLCVGMILLSLLCWTGFVKACAGSTWEDTAHDTGAGSFALQIPYKGKIDEIWEDTLFLKNYLSKLDSIITYLTMREIPSQLVIKGEDRWLFYKNNSDGNTIADYEGTELYSTEVMEDICKRISDSQNKLADLGAEFVLLVAPNKEIIYHEFMPDSFTYSQRSRADYLIEYLAESGINVIYPKNELWQNSTAVQLYYKYDTHWNQPGAYVGVKAVADLWNIKLSELKDCSIEASELRDNYHLCAEDDLAKMVGMRLIFDDETEYTIKETEATDWAKFEEEQGRQELSYFYNGSAKKNAKLLLIGDSFRTSMIPALRTSFSDVYVVDRSFYYPEMLDEIKPDYVILESVERYLGSVIGL